MSAARTAPGPGGVRGVGVDAVDVARFRAVLARRPTVADRLFTDEERRYAEAARDPGPRYAVRFAAKEAALKAFGVGVGAADFRELEVVRAEGGAPGLVLRGRAAALAQRLGVARCHLSLTHTDLVAVATVVAEGATATVVAEGSTATMAEGTAVSKGSSPTDGSP